MNKGDDELVELFIIVAAILWVWWLLSYGLSYYIPHGLG